MASATISLIFLASGLLYTGTNYSGFVKPIKSTNTSVVSYDELHDEALFNCPFAKATADNEAIISMLIDVEKKFNLPKQLRGMLLAAACHESGYNPKAAGDHKFSKKKKAMAIGLFQMWPWWERHYKIDRTSPEQSATAYMSHVKSKLGKVKRQCGINKLDRLWVAAWATAIRAPKPGGRCGEQPKFYRILKRWHASIKIAKELENSCKDDSCGC